MMYVHVIMPLIKQVNDYFCTFNSPESGLDEPKEEVPCSISGVGSSGSAEVEVGLVTE
jgi:hypothetical protein